MKRALKAALDLVLPRSCVHCNDTVEDSPFDFLCTTCAKELIPCLPPACKTCGYPFFGAVIGPQVCPHCVELDPIFDMGKALFIAKGPGLSLLHELKYHNGHYVLKDLQQLICTSKHYLDYLQDAILVPVPLHATKLRERGYNQSECIATMLAALPHGSASVQNLLIRQRYTQTQTRLNQNERHLNVKNAFAMSADTVLIPDKQYILVDDVFTTGSTLNACASVLRQAGATRLKVVTIGHG